MRPLSVWATAYGPFERVEWTIPTGVTAIVGRNDGEGINSNGAGKTKLLEILPLALFGPSSALSEHLTTGGASTTCEIGLEFAHACDQYRIVRTYTAQGRGKTELRFERARAGIGRGSGLAPLDEVTDWETLTREKQDETQREIERVLGISPATFEQSVFSRQFARHFANPELPPRERKEILAEALGLGVYDQLLDAAKSAASAVDTRAATLRGALGQWETLLADRGAAELAAAAARGRVTQFELDEKTQTERHQTLQQSYEQARAARGKVDQARQLLAAREQTLVAFQRKLEEAKAAAAAADQLTDELETLSNRMVNLPVLEERVETLKAAAGERSRALEQQRDLNDRADREAQTALVFRGDVERIAQRIAGVEAHLATPPAECDRCGQPVAAAARERVVAGLRADLERLQAERANAEEKVRICEHAAGDLRARAAAVVVPAETDAQQLADAVAELGEARAASVQAEGVRARLHAAQQTVVETSKPEFVDAHAAAGAEVASAQQELQNLEASVIGEEQTAVLARDALGAKVVLEETQRQLATARTELGGLEERVRAIAEAEQKASGARTELAGLQQRAGVLAELVKAYSRDGIPALIMESTAIPQIEREAQRILDLLGVPFRIELRTLAQQKTTERLKDTLDVVVHEPNGERRYETYSGGERARINVALRIALARLLAHRRGASMEVFALDEVEHLDAAGVAKLAELLRDLQREIPVVIFISHVEAMLDSFDQTITVVREGGVSRLEEAA